MKNWVKGTRVSPAKPVAPAQFFGAVRVSRPNLLLGTAFAAALVFSSPTFAQSMGGTGGNGNTGITGGAGGDVAAAANPGTPSATSGDGAGGGGGGSSGMNVSGGSSTAGGAGGNNDNGAGGGTAGAAGGGAGGAATTTDAGGGGGGGGFGGGGIPTSGTVTGNSSASGFGGGGGGAAAGTGGGGGGGAGGIGVATANGSLTIEITNSGGSNLYQGGQGGAGGTSVDGQGGSGGSGGAGLFIQGSETILTLGSASGGNTTTITGGTGGKAGTGGAGNGTAGAGGAGIQSANGANITLNPTARVSGGAGALSLGAGNTGGAGGAGIIGSGLTIVNAGTIAGGAGGAANGGTAGVAGNAITFTGGTNSLTTNGGSYSGNIGVTGSLTLDQTTSANATGSAAYSNVFSGTGSITILTDSGKSVTLSGPNTYTGGTTLTAGTLTVGNNSALGTGAITFNGGTLQAGGNFTLANTGQVTSAGGTIDSAGNILTYSGMIGGAGGLTIISSSGTGSVVFSNSGYKNYTGATTISGGTLAGGAANAFSAASATSVATGGTLDLGGYVQTINSVSLNGGAILNGTLIGAISSAGGTVDNIGGSTGLTTTAGTTDVLGTNSYTGTTTVSGGTLVVDGSVTGTSSVTVDGGTLTVNGTLNDPTINAGGTLNGTGTVGDTIVNSGGTFAPGDGTAGTSETIAGNLTLMSGSTYVIDLNPTTSTFANVTGTASLGGGVQANFANGSYISKTYTILTSAGGLNGTTFSGVTNVNLPANFHDSLSYDANDAYLDLTLNFVPPPPTPGDQQNLAGLNRNQLAVANTLVNYFNSNGGIPTKFGALPGAALSQIDGEGNTGAEHAAFQLEGQFLNVMLDPFVDGRAGGGGEGFSASAAGTQGRESGMLAYADGQTLPILKGPPPAPIYTPRWSAWGAAYGGISHSDGNAATGSNDLRADTFGFAGGMDYHVSPDTLLGFALAGGGTNWNLANVSGSGHSTALQAGVYAITHSGPLYGAAAFGFTNNWFDTNRTALGDQLQANFGGQSYGGRLEGGYHLSNLLNTLPFGVTPYAAVQAQDFVTPGYSENDITGGGFGLSYNAMSASDVRTEIGSRFEDVTSLDNMPLVLRGKLAWAHDFVSNPSLNAAFESLPGTSFIVNGAPIPHNSALVSGGAELFLAPHWSVLAKFDGEFAGNSQTYGGTGTLKYTW